VDVPLSGKDNPALYATCRCVGAKPGGCGFTPFTVPLLIGPHRLHPSRQGQLLASIDAARIVDARVGGQQLVDRGAVTPCNLGQRVAAGDLDGLGGGGVGVACRANDRVAVLAINGAGARPSNPLLGDRRRQCGLRLAVIVISAAGVDETGRRSADGCVIFFLDAVGQMEALFEALEGELGPSARFIIAGGITGSSLNRFLGIWHTLSLQKYARIFASQLDQFHAERT